MRGEQNIVIEDVPTPEPGPGQVLIKIKYSGLCGSDVHRFQYGMAEPGSIMGHEFCGEIAAVGAGVTRFKEGDRVVGGGGSNPDGSSKLSSKLSSTAWANACSFAVHGRVLEQT